ncbi:MAG: thioredoxin-like domain-containing protein [Chitinophagaceae bacterium]
MKRIPGIINTLYYFILLLSPFFLSAQMSERKLKVNLRGVFESKISLIPLLGGNALKAITEIPGVRNGAMVTMLVPAEKLPGEFILRFDYKENEASIPYPSEKHIFISKQDIEIRVNPQFVNSTDSTMFQQGEIENNKFAEFSKENDRLKKKLALLNNLLLNYDDPKSRFYLEGVKEYELRRNTYNSWLEAEIYKARDAFVGNAFRFHFVPKINWKGNETERLQSLISHYFDHMDFKEALLANTTDLKEWMTKYVNLYGQLATTLPLRDSLFLTAAETAIEKARLGHPVIYGWMVDYFYNGFERNNLWAGIRLLEKYINDPACMTSKRLAIAKRLQGIKTLMPGTDAPDFVFIENDKPSRFRDYQTSSPYKLVLFWTTGCEHCKELIKSLYPYFLNKLGKNGFEVFAISLDDSDQEVLDWQLTIKSLTAWKHWRNKGGVNSPEANAYFLVSTPLMVLVDSKTNKIIALPENVEQLEKEIMKR